MVKLINISVPVIFAMVAGYSCQHEPLIPVITKTPVIPATPEDTSICFERDILPIFSTNCAKAGCHDNITHEEGLVLNTYSGIMADNKIIPGNPTGSEMYIQLSTGKMSLPQYGNLNQSQKDLIKRWIIEGAKDGKNCPTKCDTAIYTFSKAVNPIIQKTCVGCHNPNSLNGNTDLSTYNGVANAGQSGKLVSSLKRSTNWMPSGLNRLSDCQIRQIEKWVADGVPNN